MNLDLLVPLVLVAVPAYLLVSYLVPLRFWVRAAGFCSALQFYTLPAAGVYLSAAHLSSLASWRALPALRALAREPWLYAVVLLIAAQLLSILWSPDPMLGLRQLIYALPFLCLLGGAMVLASRFPQMLGRLLIVTLYSAAIVAALTILFRVLPSVKVRFLLSPVANLFISRSLLQEVFSKPGVYTVLDPGKSGGVFINANTASAYLGLSAMLAWNLAATLGRPCSLKLTAALCWTAVLFTGSKAGILLAATVPWIPMLTRLARTRRIDSTALVTMIVAVVFALVLLVGLNQVLATSSYLSDSAATLQTRFGIWRFAFAAFARHPILGLGFGGWELQWPGYAYAHGLSPYFPPHNALLALWAQSGIVAMLAGALFGLLLTQQLLRLALSSPEPAAEVATAVLAGVLWVFAQAQGENFGLLGEAHITPVMALVLGHLYGQPAQEGST